MYYITKGEFPLKVEKINNNKAMIVMTLEELTKRKITLKDIKEGAKNVQDLFFEILDDANIIQDFTLDSSSLFVEVATTEDNIFVITVTRADCIADVATFDKLQNASHTSYTVSSNLYRFSNLKELYDFCICANKENLFIGNNSLYILNDKYFLMFSNSTIRKSDFVKTFSVISEYADKYFSKQSATFLEYANLLLSKHAIQTLQLI